MHDPLTFASFFSGVAGLDMGLVRAGWRPVAFAENEPYASTVLAERYDVPNLGDVLELEPDAIPDATLWTGGFPCQDLSTAGRRLGLGIDYSLGDLDPERLRATRSGLALAFLAAVERRRPRWILLENVEGLRSSHSGRDLATLVGRLADLGYWWAFRVLDARFVGGCALHGRTAVPQRRRRLFLVASADEDGPEAVLTGPDSGAFDPEPGGESGEGGGTLVADGAGLVGSLPAGTHGFPASLQELAQGFFRAVVVDPARPETDAARVRASHGVAGRVDDREDLATSPVAVYRKQHRAASVDDAETWVDDGVANTLTNFDSNSDGRTTHLVVAERIVIEEDEEMLPVGLDSHRYRCTGNGVAAPVSEWIGGRLRARIEGRL